MYQDTHHAPALADIGHTHGFSHSDTPPPATHHQPIQNMQYNVPGGKLNRGLSVVHAFKAIVQREVTPEETFRLYVLGWCVELLQAFFLVADDVMDGSITRRGQPCWYKNVCVCCQRCAVLWCARIQGANSPVRNFSVFRPGVDSSLGQPSPSRLGRMFLNDHSDMIVRTTRSQEQLAERRER